MLLWMAVLRGAQMCECRQEQQGGQEGQERWSGKHAGRAAGVLGMARRWAQMWVGTAGSHPPPGPMTHLSGSGSRPAALPDGLLRSLAARGPPCQLPWHPWIARLAWRRWPHVAVDGCPARGTDV